MRLKSAGRQLPVPIQQTNNTVTNNNPINNTITKQRNEYDNVNDIRDRNNTMDTDDSNASSSCLSCLFSTNTKYIQKK